MELIEEVAAAWLVERDRGFTPGREREFARWLQADERHAAVFDALSETWTLLGESRPESAGSPLAEFPRRRLSARWTPALAAAALALAALGGWHVLRETAAPQTGRYSLAAATEVGRLRSIPLPDGSTIQLNTDSAVDVQFEPHLRRVRLLRGEAHFTVARNVNRPFVVEAAGVDVRVLGTVFNVRLRPEAVDVLVTHGRVQVGSAPAPANEAEVRSRTDAPVSELTAGQRTSVALVASRPEPVAPVEVSPNEIRQALAWQSRRLEFDATPLRDIVAEFNRYNRHKLIVADERLEVRRFGGSFPAADYETFIRMLEVDFGVVTERRSTETVLRAKGP